MVFSKNVIIFLSKNGSLCTSCHTRVDVYYCIHDVDVHYDLCGTCMPPDLKVIFALTHQ